MARPIDGAPAQLIDRLLELLEDRAPQIRAVVTTLLIKAIEEDGSSLISLMVKSDGAAMLIDKAAASDAHRQLTSALREALCKLAREHGEERAVRAWRDYLLSQMQRWATSAVNDADNRRRAERFLLWADNPQALAVAQRRGIFAGLTSQDLRELARSRAAEPVSPETATELWAQLEAWRSRATALLGDDVLEDWQERSVS